MKYIVTVDERTGKEELFMFPKSINHDFFAEAVSRIKYGTEQNWERFRRSPIAAGFTDGTKCTGRSETLNLDSRGPIDEALITV
jgi:hypothetical protein